MLFRSSSGSPDPTNVAQNRAVGGNDLLVGILNIVIDTVATSPPSEPYLTASTKRLLSASSVPGSSVDSSCFWSAVTDLLIR